jgi:hypothetical protein
MGADLGEKLDQARLIKKFSVMRLDGKMFCFTIAATIRQVLQLFIMWGDRNVKVMGGEKKYWRKEEEDTEERRQGIKIRKTSFPV